MSRRNCGIVHRADTYLHRFHHWPNGFFFSRNVQQCYLRNNLIWTRKPLIVHSTIQTYTNQCVSNNKYARLWFWYLDEFDFCAYWFIRFIRCLFSEDIQLLTANFQLKFSLYYSEYHYYNRHFMCYRPLQMAKLLSVRFVMLRWCAYYMTTEHVLLGKLHIAWILTRFIRAIMGHAEYRGKEKPAVTKQLFEQHRHHLLKSNLAFGREQSPPRRLNADLVLSHRFRKWETDRLKSLNFGDR